MADGPPFPAPLVLEVLRTCKEAGIEAYLSGGWGLDALVGHQTREHHDLDLAVAEQDVATAIAVLSSHGFLPSAQPPSGDREQREAAAIAGLADLGYVVEEGGPSGARLHQQWIHGPDERNGEAEALLARLGVDPVGLPTAELRDAAGHVVMLHRLLIGEGEWQDPEIGPRPTWIPVAAGGTPGHLGDASVAGVPAAMHALRLDQSFFDSEVVLRDLLLLRKAGWSGEISGDIPIVTGVVPAGEVAAAYMRYWRRLFPGPGLEMAELHDDPDRWADDVIDRVGVFSAGTTIEVAYGWEIMLALVAAAADDEELGHVAAGPVEDYLSEHGEAAIERVEAQATADAKFARMLRGVWQLGMSDEIHARIRAAASGDPW